MYRSLCVKFFLILIITLVILIFVFFGTSIVAGLVARKWIFSSIRFDWSFQVFYLLKQSFFFSFVSNCHKQNNKMHSKYKKWKMRINWTPWLINESFEFWDNFLIPSKEATYLIITFLFQFLYQIIVLLRDFYCWLKGVQFSELVLQAKKFFVFFFLNLQTYALFVDFVFQAHNERLACHIDIFFLPFLPADSMVGLGIQWPKFYIAFIAFFLLIRGCSPVNLLDVWRFCVIRFALK